MVFEFAEFHVRPGEQRAFEEAMTHALATITARASGMKGYRFFRCAESPERYLLQVEWEKIEDHLVTWKKSGPRDEWLRIVTPFYAQTPLVAHYSVVTSSG